MFQKQTGTCTTWQLDYPNTLSFEQVFPFRISDKNIWRMYFSGAYRIKNILQLFAGDLFEASVLAISAEYSCWASSEDRSCDCACWHAIDGNLDYNNGKVLFTGFCIEFIHSFIHSFTDPSVSQPPRWFIEIITQLYGSIIYVNHKW